MARYIKSVLKIKFYRPTGLNTWKLHEAPRSYICFYKQMEMDDILYWFSILQTPTISNIAKESGLSFSKVSALLNRHFHKKSSV